MIFRLHSTLTREQVRESWEYVLLVLSIAPLEKWPLPGGEEALYRWAWNIDAKLPNTLVITVEYTVETKSSQQDQRIRAVEVLGLLSPLKVEVVLNPDVVGVAG